MARVPISRSHRRSVIARDGVHCFWCDRLTVHRPTRIIVSPDDQTIDHFTPVAHGGDNRLDNLVVACQHCNNMRGDMNADDFKDLLDRLSDRRCDVVRTITQQKDRT